MSTPQIEPDWQKTWNARLAALSQFFGKPADVVYHAVVPFNLGGQADVVPFPNYLGGVAYVTSEMTGEETGQIPNELGSCYELMICTRVENKKRVPDIIARLARYTCDAKLEAGETMDIGEYFGDKTIRALLFCHPTKEPISFELNQKSCGVLLCIGITKEELALKMKEGASVLLDRLQNKGIFPFTEPDRASVI